jgi:hypothetical protein
VAPQNVPRVGTLNTLILDHPEFRYVLLAIEAVCVGVYMFDAYLYNGFRPRGAGSSPAWSIEGQKGRDLWVLTRVAIAVTMALDIVLALSGLGLLRFSRPLRPFIMATRKRGAKEVLKNIGHTVPAQGKVLFGVFCVIGLWAFVGFLLFKDTESFGTVARSFQSMLTVFLAASFNQQLAEAQLTRHDYRAVAALFFVSFLVVCNMFLLKLITAVAFDSFQKFARAERIEVLNARKIALDRAFDLVSEPELDNEDDLRMSLESFARIMSIADGNVRDSNALPICNHVVHVLMLHGQQ